MLYPQKNKFIRWLFHHYILNLVKRNFRQVNFNFIEVSKNKSVLLLANHFSWWDGFLLYYINQKVFRKQFHVMVREETVQKVSFFKYMGAFSVNKNTREILTSLDYAAKLLNDPENLVLIFPQGKLFSNFIDEVSFEKGLVKILQGVTGKFQTVYAATFIEGLQYKKPSVNVYLATAEAGKGHENIADLQQAYQQHYDGAKAQQTKIAV
jgi:1-acyl-sn-glycerol-3-phosphate acyltransferase